MGKLLQCYEDKAVITINEKTFTDLRYQGYQEQIGDFIIDLRSMIVSYNRSYINKQTYNTNVLFSWFIIGVDDDMKLMQLKEQL